MCWNRRILKFDRWARSWGWRGGGAGVRDGSGRSGRRGGKG
jgi:hypothetical protein